jgi:hypothetical protein
MASNSKIAAFIAVLMTGPPAIGSPSPEDIAIEILKNPGLTFKHILDAVYATLANPRSDGYIHINMAFHVMRAFHEQGCFLNQRTNYKDLENMTLLEMFFQRCVLMYQNTNVVTDQLRVQIQFVERMYALVGTPLHKDLLWLKSKVFPPVVIDLTVEEEQEEEQEQEKEEEMDVVDCCGV